MGIILPKFYLWCIILQEKLVQSYLYNTLLPTRYVNSDIQLIEQILRCTELDVS